MSNAWDAKAILFFLAQLWFASSLFSLSYVSNFDRGRLGNNLISYCKAKMLEDKYRLFFLLTPFYMAERFRFYELEKSIADINRKEFTEFHLKKEHNFRRTLSLIEAAGNADNRLFLCHLSFKEDNKNYSHSLHIYLKENPAFRDKLRRLIAPLEEIKPVLIPENRLSVAVHVRKGGYFDRPLYAKQLYNSRAVYKRKKNFKHSFSDKRYPRKFPSDYYYLEQITKISDKLHDPPLYVHIFTDDPHPKELLEAYAGALNRPNILWGCEKRSDILRDLFSMAKFDFLIRPSSTFSEIAQIIGHHKLVIYPLTTEWKKDRVLEVTSVGYYGNGINFR